MTLHLGQTEETQGVTSPSLSLDIQRTEASDAFNEFIRKLEGDKKLNNGIKYILFKKATSLVRTIPTYEDLTPVYEILGALEQRYASLTLQNITSKNRLRSLHITDARLKDELYDLINKPLKHLKDKITVATIKSLIQKIGTIMHVPHKFDDSREGSRIHYQLNGAHGGMHIHGGLHGLLDSGRLVNFRTFLMEAGVMIDPQEF